LTQKMGANEEPMSLWHGDETADTLFLRRPKYFAPLDGDESTLGYRCGAAGTTPRASRAKSPRK
jgi:hypothetical protein